MTRERQNSVFICELVQILERLEKLNAARALLNSPHMRYHLAIQPTKNGWDVNILYGLPIPGHPVALVASTPIPWDWTPTSVAHREPLEEHEAAIKIEVLERIKQLGEELKKAQELVK